MIGRIIRWNRLMAGWSMNALAKRMHITVSHLSNIEKGRRKPSIEIEIWVSEIFNIPPHFSEVEKIDSECFYPWIKQIVSEEDFDKIALIRRIQKEKTLTPQQYLASEIFAHSLTTFTKKKKQKEIVEFLHTIYLNESMDSELRRAALFYLLMNALDKKQFDEAEKYANRYIKLIKPDEQEERVCMLLRRSMIQWNRGVRADLLRTLTEIRSEIDQLENPENFLVAWNYLYGKCMIYYGFIDEAAHFLEKNIKQPKPQKQSKAVLELISKILLFAYTDKITPEKKSIVATIKRNASNHCFMLNVAPYIYTMASSLLNFGKTEEAKQVASLAEEYPLTSEDLPNRQFYLILLNAKEENQAVVECLSEQYFEEESRIAANPFQAMDVCKLMIQHFEGKNQYKSASKWGHLATKISTTYFGTRSLA